MSINVAKEPLILVSGDSITSLQFAGEIKMLLRFSKVKQIKVAFQEGSSGLPPCVLRIDLMKNLIEASSHLPEKVIEALSQAFGDTMKIHVKPEKTGQSVFSQSNTSLLFHSQPAKAPAHQDKVSKSSNKETPSSPLTKKL